MATPPVAWEQTPSYLAATDTRIVPGGPATYAVARPVGLGGPTDVTSYHPGQHLWDVTDNLPSILYQLRPPEVWYTFKRSGLPTRKLDVNNIPMFEQHPEPGTVARPLLDFQVLPDVIGSDESALILEAWRRLDPRIRWADITMRMDRASRPNENALNMRACRYWRPAYSLISWHGKGTSRKETTVLALLSQTQRDNNTTRGTTPGFIDPNLGGAGGRIDHPIHRNGQGQGRPQRTVTTSSTAEDDEEQSDNSDETSDDVSDESEEDDHKDGDDEDLNVDEVEEEQDADEGPDIDEKLDSDGMLDVDRELDGKEVSNSVAAGMLDPDNYEVLLDEYEEEYYSDSSLHSPIFLGARRTEHDKSDNCRVQKGAKERKRDKRSEDNKQRDAKHSEVQNPSEDGGIASVPNNRTDIDSRDFSHLPEEYTFGPLEAKPSWSHYNQANHVVAAREKRRRDSTDSDSEDETVAMRRMLRAQSLASFETAAKGRPVLLRDAVFYKWGTHDLESPIPIPASTADDHADRAFVNTDLGRRSLSEADELLSFAGSGLKTSITESSALGGPTSGIPGINEPSDYSTHSDAA